MSGAKGKTLPIDLKEIRRVLVIKPSSMGDIVHTLPAIHDLKRSFPHLEITWLANTEWLPLLQGQRDLVGALEFPRQRLRGWRRSPAAFRWLAQELRPLKPDLALDFQGLLRSGLMAWGCRARYRVGMSDSREGSRRFHHHRVEVDAGAHAVDRYRGLVAALGVDTGSEARFHLGPGEVVARPLPEDFVAFHPFSRGEGKSLTVSQVNAFCDAMDRPVVLLGRVASEERAQLRLPAHCIDLLNETSIPQLIHCLHQAAKIVSVDSGPMHVAAAISGERVLGIHTWSDPRKVGPYPEAAWVWKGKTILQRRALTPAICETVSAFEDRDVEALIVWASD